MGIIGLTFMGHEVEMMLIPVIYGLTILLTAAIATLIFRAIDNRVMNLEGTNSVLKTYHPHK